MAIIQTRSLTKRYDSLTAVEDLDLNIEEGEVFGILGPNGAGKTTLLLMLTTLLKPSGGYAKVNGFDIVKESANVRRCIGMVFQEPSCDDILTGYENLKLHALMYGVPSDTREKRITESLELVGLTHRAHDLVKKYSGGMRRRLEIARGLLHQPKILFLDEPTLGLDPQSREAIWRHIEALNRERKITVVITTHYMDEADRLCHRVAIVDQGRILTVDEPQRLKHLLGGDIICLQTDNPPLDALKNLPYVGKVEVEGDLLTLTVKEANVHLQEILRIVNPVKLVELRSPTLNDVFLHFTGRRIRDEGESAEGGFWERRARFGK